MFVLNIKNISQRRQKMLDRVLKSES